MADEVVAAEPSSAQAEPSFAEFEAAANAKDITGKEPDQPKPAGSEPADAPKAAKPAPAAEQAEVPPEPGAGEKPQEKAQKPKLGAEERIGQLTAREKEANERAQRAERELAAERAKHAPKEAPKAADEVKALDYKAFKAEWVEKNPEGTYDELSAAWSDAVSDNKLKLYQAEQTKTQREAAQKERVANFEKDWNERREKAAAKYQDFKEVAEDPNLPLVEGGLVDAFIANTAEGAELLYEMGKDRTALDTLQKTHPIEAGIELSIRVLKLRGYTITAPEDKSKAAAASAAPPAPPAKRITSAPKPSAPVGGRGTAPEDEVAAAGKGDSFAEFEQAANARDLAQRQKG